MGTLVNCVYVNAGKILLQHLCCKQMDAAGRNERMIKVMTYLADHLFSLRQEIAHLQNMNNHYASKTEHSPLDESALELRTVRLRQIKKELADMLVRPNNPKVWWERLPKSRIA